MNYKIPAVLLLLATCYKISNAGFLQSPFQYYVNPGAPITSVASPFVHGFGSPIYSPFVNFYHQQPILKTFYQPVQPLYYHQVPLLSLPAPKFYSLPQTAAASDSAPSGGYQSRDTQEDKSGQQPTAYGAPSGLTAPNNNQIQFSSDYNKPDTENRFSGPSGSGPSASASGPSGYNPSSSSQIEVFEDDFSGDKDSVIIDSNQARNPSRSNDNQSRPNDGFQGFIANRSGDRGMADRPEYMYKDNSVRDGQGRPREYRAPSQGSSQGGYA